MEIKKGAEAMNPDILYCSGCEFYTGECIAPSGAKCHPESIEEDE